MRTFIAIDITPEIRQHIVDFMEKVRAEFPGARWARPEGMHITLKFIGEISVEQKARVEAALKTVTVSPFDLGIKDTGFFPNERSPRVFWAGIHAGDALPKLASMVDEALNALGFPRERHSYKPHLTLARFNLENRRVNPAASARTLQQRPQPEFGKMTANEFFLYESKLSPHGARYGKLAQFKLH